MNDQSKMNIVSAAMAARRDSESRATAHPIWLVQRRVWRPAHEHGDVRTDWETLGESEDFPDVETIAIGPEGEMARDGDSLDMSTHADLSDWRVISCAWAWETIPQGYYLDAASASVRMERESRKHDCGELRIYVDALSREAGAVLDAVDVLTREVDA